MFFITNIFILKHRENTVISTFLKSKTPINLTIQVNFKFILSLTLNCFTLKIMRIQL